MNDTLLETAKDAARAGADVLTHYLGKAEVNFKEGSTQNLVTQADVEAEAAVVDVIRRQYPTHAILGEEGGGEVDYEAEHLWIVDPLDGTTNYVHRIPQFCTAVAYASRGEIQRGVVLDPCRQELFHAVRGAGAFLNGEPISVSQNSAFTEAVIATGFYYDRGDMMRQTLSSIEKLFENNVRGVRRLGAAALDLCWVACGRWEGFFEYRLSPWTTRLRRSWLKKLVVVVQTVLGIRYRLVRETSSQRTRICLTRSVRPLLGKDSKENKKGSSQSRRALCIVSFRPRVARYFRRRRRTSGITAAKVAKNAAAGSGTD